MKKDNKYNIMLILMYVDGSSQYIEMTNVWASNEDIAKELAYKAAKVRHLKNKVGSALKEIKVKECFLTLRSGI